MSAHVSQARNQHETALFEGLKVCDDGILI
jgi:hypothetical protein